MGRGKQIAVLVLIAILMLACVYLGIQIKNRPAPSDDELVYRGSYKETQIPLPIINAENGEEYLQLLRGINGEIELYTILLNEDGTHVHGYKKYVLNEELKWDESESDWMSLETFSDTSNAIRMMSYAETGTLYLVLHNLAALAPENDEVMRVTSSGTVERVGVRGLYKVDELERPIKLAKMFISNNMICITDELFNSYAYSLVSGELYASGKNSTLGGLASDGDYLYLLSESYNAVVPYRISDGKPDAQRKLWDRTMVWEEKESEYEAADYQLLSQDGVLYLSCQDGILTYNTAAGKWDLLLDGTECIFGRPSVTQQSFIAVGDQFYMFGKDTAGTAYFAMYNMRTEDEDAALDRTDFHISSYRRNAIITEAVVAFQHNNPSLHVIYDVALDKDPSLSVEDYRLQVQKSIQDGTAADILVCDELDYPSYIDSGFFENISDLMKPMYTSADLYGNLTNAMAQSKIFVTPAKFDVYLSYGAADILGSMDSFDSLASYSENKKTPALGTVTPDELAYLLSSFYEDEFIPEQEIDSEALLRVLGQAKTSARLSESAPDKEKDKESDSEDPKKALYAKNPGIIKISSSQSFLELAAYLKESSRTFSSARGRFTPRDIVGINSQSKNIKLAKDFIRTMYSDSVQQTGVGSGIPMQKTAVEKWKEESVLESDLSLLSTCLSSLDTVYRERDVLHASISSVLPALFADEMSVEDAVDAILNYIPTEVSK